MQKSDFIRTVKELNLDPSDYVVIGSGVLCALGLRDADDVDVIVSEPVFRSFEKQSGWKRKDFDDGSYYLVHGIYEIGLDWDSEDAQPNLADLKKDEVLIEDVPFVSLQRLKHWKQKKGRERDLRDIELIEGYPSNSP